VVSSASTEREEIFGGGRERAGVLSLAGRFWSAGRGDGGADFTRQFGLFDGELKEKR